MIYHSVVGLIVWVLATLGFRFYGQLFFYPDDIVLAMLFIVSAPVLWGFMVLYLGILKVMPVNRALAAVAFVLPGLLLDALVTANFAVVFPNLDISLGSRFGALMMWAYAWLLFGGYSSQRRARRHQAVIIQTSDTP